MGKVPITVIPADLVDAYAIQALHRGDATPDQQKRALKCIAEEIAGAYRMSFDPDSARNTDFAEGSRHVGRTIANIIHADLAKLRQAEKTIAKREAEKTKVNTRRKRGDK